jgi:hypothetical protein
MPQTNGSTPSLIARWLRVQSHLHELLDPDDAKTSLRSKVFLMIADAHPRGLDQSVFRNPKQKPSPGVASTHIDEFLAKGLVELWTHPDGRKNLLRLTRSGEAQKRKIIKILEGDDH